MTGKDTLFSGLSAIRTEIELADFLHKLSDHFEFTGFLLITIPAVSDEQLRARIVLSDLPGGMLEAYDELGLLKNSLVFERLRRSTVPASWSIATANGNRPPEEAKAADRLFASYNITRSAFFPVHGAGGARAALGFMGNRKDLTHTELGDLGMFAAHAYDIYSTLKDTNKAPECLLTPRELEALHWAANGKTSGEIASILSLSDHTVNTYMNNAMRKLDCVNRVQLVAKALRMHLIC